MNIFWKSVAFIGSLIATFVLAGMASVRAASDNSYDGNWHFSLTPYLWLPSTSGDLNFGIPNGTAGTELLDSLNFAFMGAVDARKGRWSGFSDFVYLDVSGSKARVKTISGPGGALETPVNLDTKVGISGFVWTSAIGYSIYHSNTMTADVFAGFRALSISPSLDWDFAAGTLLLPRSGHLSQDQDLWDGIIGMRGRLSFPDSNWYIPYYGDIGTGESNFTGQVMTGAGYSFSWADMSLVYRYLYYESGQGKLIQSASFHGFALGLTFHL